MNGIVAIDNRSLRFPVDSFSNTFEEFVIKIFPGAVDVRNSWHDLPSEIVSHGDNVGETESEMKSARGCMFLDTVAAR